MPVADPSLTTLTLLTRVCFFSFSHLPDTTLSSLSSASFLSFWLFSLCISSLFPAPADASRVSLFSLSRLLSVFRLCPAPWRHHQRRALLCSSSSCFLRLLQAPAAFATAVPAAEKSFIFGAPANRSWLLAAPTALICTTTLATTTLRCNDWPQTTTRGQTSLSHWGAAVGRCSHLPR